MKKFTLAKTDKEVKADEKLKENLLSHGIQESEIDTIVEEYYGDKQFGKGHTFKELSDCEKEILETLFAEREKTLKQYKKVEKAILDLMKDEMLLWARLNDVSKNICKIEGHRLSDPVTDNIEPDDYGDTSFVRYTRTCVVCGKKFSRDDITQDDVVVKEKDGFPRRLVYAKDK